MFKTLVKKQFSEVFRSYFYDAKKNSARSKKKIIGYFIFFALVMIGLLGGIFTGLSLALCEPMLAADMGFLYFVLMGGIAIALGAFGSIFNTFSGLYLSKDNDLLLSMPIPVKVIIGSRLVNVYILGGMYSIVVILPAVIVYLAIAGPTAGRIIGGIAIIIAITLIVLILSCLLGWCIAKISLKLKNKSMITVLVSLVFIGAYFFFCFRTNDLITTLIERSAYYGGMIKDGYYAAYLFGRIGEGDYMAMLIWLGICLVLMALTWIILRNTFMGIAAATGKTGAQKVKEAKLKEKSVFMALLSKEFSKFISSPNYMLNCGLGMILVPICSVVLLIKGEYAVEMLNSIFGEGSGVTLILICTALCTLAAMNDMAAPSVSLEGRSIWIPQSLPIETKTVLHAKLSMHIILTGAVMIFASICVMTVLKEKFAVKLLVCLVSLLFGLFTAIFSLFFGVRMANLSWTSEIVPIKQSGAVTISMFGAWALVAVFTILFFVGGKAIGAAAYLAIWAVIFAAASVIMFRWLNTKGVEMFKKL